MNKIIWAFFGGGVSVFALIWIRLPNSILQVRKGSDSSILLLGKEAIYCFLRKSLNFLQVMYFFNSPFLYFVLFSTLLSLIMKCYSHRCAEVLVNLKWNIFSQTYWINKLVKFHPFGKIYLTMFFPFIKLSEKNLLKFNNQQISFIEIKVRLFNNECFSIDF